MIFKNGWFCFTELDTKAQNLKHHSSKYKKDASLLNATSWMAIGAGGTILFLVFFIWYKFLLWNCFFENNFVIGKKKHLKYFLNKTYPAFQIVKVILNSIFKKKYIRLLYRRLLLPRGFCTTLNVKKIDVKSQEVSFDLCHVRPLKVLT